MGNVPSGVIFHTFEGGEAIDRVWKVGSNFGYDNEQHGLRQRVAWAARRREKDANEAELGQGDHARGYDVCTDYHIDMWIVYLLTYFGYSINVFLHSGNKWKN